MYRQFGAVNPQTIETLVTAGYTVEGLRSKSIDELKGGRFDMVITVCDNARETCPVWPEKTELFHWSSRDPAAYEGTDSEKKRFFTDIFKKIERKITTFLDEQV